MKSLANSYPKEKKDNVWVLHELTETTFNFFFTFSGKMERNAIKSEVNE